MVLGTLVYIALIIIAIIVIVVLLKFMFGVLFIAPIATEGFIAPGTFYSLTVPPFNGVNSHLPESVVLSSSDI
jgi:hypothetical protein